MDAFIFFNSFNKSLEPMTQLLATKSQQPVTWIEFSPDGKTFATASYSGSVQIWKSIGNIQVKKLERSARFARFSPTGEELLTSSDDSNAVAIVWDTKTWTEKVRFVEPKSQGAQWASFGPDPSIVFASSHLDGKETLFVWESKTGTRIASYDLSKLIGIGVCTADWKVVVAASHGGILKWNFQP